MTADMLRDCAGLEGVTEDMLRQASQEAAIMYDMYRVTAPPPPLPEKQQQSQRNRPPQPSGELEGDASSRPCFASIGAARMEARDRRRLIEARDRRFADQVTPFPPVTYGPAPPNRPSTTQELELNPRARHQAVFLSSVQSELSPPLSEPPASADGWLHVASRRIQLVVAGRAAAAHLAESGTAKREAAKLAADARENKRFIVPRATNEEEIWNASAARDHVSSLHLAQSVESVQSALLVAIDQLLRDHARCRLDETDVMTLCMERLALAVAMALARVRGSGAEAQGEMQVAAAAAELINMQTRRQGEEKDSPLVLRLSALSSRAPAHVKGCPHANGSLRRFCLVHSLLLLALLALTSKKNLGASTRKVTIAHECRGRT